MLLVSLSLNHAKDFVEIRVIETVVLSERVIVIVTRRKYVGVLLSRVLTAKGH